MNKSDIHRYICLIDEIENGIKARLLEDLQELKYFNSEDIPGMKGILLKVYNSYDWWEKISEIFVAFHKELDIHKGDVENEQD